MSQNALNLSTLNEKNYVISKQPKCSNSYKFKSDFTCSRESETEKWNIVGHHITQIRPLELSSNIKMLLFMKSSTLLTEEQLSLYRFKQSHLVFSGKYLLNKTT